MEAELRMLIFSPGALGHRPLKHSSAGIGSCARNAGVQHTSAKARTAPLCSQYIQYMSRHNKNRPVSSAQHLELIPALPALASE